MFRYQIDFINRWTDRAAPRRSTPSPVYRHVDLWKKKVARGNRVISGEDDASPSGDGHVRGIRDNIDAAERTTQGVPLKS
jgi:hypothetical protein